MRAAKGVRVVKAVTDAQGRASASVSSTSAAPANIVAQTTAAQVTLPVTFNGEAKDPWGNTRAGFETSTKLDRKEYGIVWNKAIDNGGVLLGDDVNIAINLETVKNAPAAAKGK